MHMPFAHSTATRRNPMETRPFPQPATAHPRSTVPAVLRNPSSVDFFTAPRRASPAASSLRLPTKTKRAADVSPPFPYPQVFTSHPVDCCPRQSQNPALSPKGTVVRPQELQGLNTGLLLLFSFYPRP